MTSGHYYLGLVQFLKDFYLHVELKVTVPISLLQTRTSMTFSFVYSPVQSTVTILLNVSVQVF